MYYTDMLLRRPDIGCIFERNPWMTRFNQGREHRLPQLFSVYAFKLLDFPGFCLTLVFFITSFEFLSVQVVKIWYVVG